MSNPSDPSFQAGTYPLSTKDLNLDISRVDTTAIVDLIPESPTSTYTRMQKAETIAYYYALRSLRRVEEMTGVPRPTISVWKNKSEWWPLVWKVFDAQKNEELDAHLTDIIDRTIHEMRDRLENGDEKVTITKEGEVKRARQKVSFRDLAVAGIGVAYDKRALGRGQATSRVEHTSETDKLQKLADQFKRMSQEKVIDGTAERLDNKGKKN